MSNTFNTTDTGRKIVCNACRARKKRCDGQRPSCSSCHGRRVLCRYESYRTSRTGSMTTGPYLQVSTPAIYSTDLTRAILEVPGDLSAFEFDGDFPSLDAFQAFTPTADMDTQTMLPWTASQNKTNPSWQQDWTDGFADVSFNFDTAHDKPLVGSAAEYTATTEATSLPDLPEIEGLVDVFFRRVHHFLPILHRTTFQASLSRLSTDTHLHALAFAVISLATCERQESSVTSSRVRWYSTAKEKYASTEHLPHDPIPTLQTAVLLIFQGMMINDFHSAWLTLGKAWRQVVALGYHHLDSNQGKSMPDAPQVPQDWIQRESIRRIVWTLYILDRGLCFPVGLVHNIEDKYLTVRLPMCEYDFQQSVQQDNSMSVHFTPSFTKLLGAVRETAARTTRENRLHYIILAYMLLGRIAALHHYSDDLDCSEKETSFRKLEDCLVSLRLCLPRSATSLSAAPSEHSKSIIWLNIIMNINSIFLYHGKFAGSCDTEFPYWHKCLTAAHNTVAIIREAGGMSADLLLNPHTASPLFCSSRILIIEHLVPSWMSDAHSRARDGSTIRNFDSSTASDALTWGSQLKDFSARQDLDLIMLVFDRLTEAFGPIGMKFKKGMLYFLQQDPGSAALLKQNGIKDIMSRCASWGAPSPGFAAAA